MGKKSNNAIVNYDTILDHIGQFGPWQQRIHFLLWLTSAAGGLAVVVYSFTAFKTPYICKPPRCESDEITYNGTAKAFVRYVCILEILFRQITTFIKVRVAFAFGLQTLYSKDFSKIYQLKGLKPKNKGHTNFYECCDLTKKVYHSNICT